MNRILMIMLRDGLRMPSGFVAEAPKNCLIYCKVPAEWVEGDIPESDDLWLKGPELKSDKLELFFESLYGKTWRYGNSDGSQYVVLGIGARLLNPSQEWKAMDDSTSDFILFHYVVDADGQFKSVSPAEF